ncbi:phosphotransferase [Caerostris darwini]|uniref:Phosphotransferase n=1 Tax=Caerostris darwini TaxID=1538125 RepID=A0AAV4QJD0_9ARAC|nr:phosphotransferase [Caerostris darwini]
MSEYGIWNGADPEIDLKLSDQFKTNLLKDYMLQYTLPDGKIHAIKRNFEKEFEDGLKRSDDETAQNISSLGMKVTYFTEFFDGTENGDFVIMCLNRRHLLLLLAKIRPGYPIETEREYFIVSENTRRSPYIQIFDYLCDCLLKFFSKHELLNKTQIVGFCTDLPIVQFGINYAMVWYFTESATDLPLNCYDMNKCFEMVLLKERYRELKIELIAVMNKNTSMFVKACYLCGKIDMFINFSDDCDLLYCENPVRVKKWAGSNSAERVLIDTELKNFGGSGCLDFIATDLEWLAATSSTSTDKRARLQKFISDQYILELIKHILIDLQHRLMFCRKTEIGKLQSDGISLTELCDFANTKDLKHAAAILLGGTIGGSVEDAMVAKYVCKIVLIRAAVLISLCMTHVMMRFLDDDFIIAVNSPLLRKHPDYETYVRNIMAILAPEKKFQFLWTEDEFSFEGAALATSIIYRMEISPRIITPISYDSAVIHF